MLLLISREGNLRLWQRNLSVSWHILGQMKHNTHAYGLPGPHISQQTTNHKQFPSCSSVQRSVPKRFQALLEMLKELGNTVSRESCVEEGTDTAMGRGHKARSDVAKLSEATVAGKRQYIYYRESIRIKMRGSILRFHCFLKGKMCFSCLHFLKHYYTTCLW